MTVRIVFMGTPEFAVPTLQALCEEFQVVGVVTQRDKPRGRGQKVSPTPIKVEALSRGLHVAELEALSSLESLALLRGWRPEVIVVAAYGKILPESVLVLPPMGCVNLHASLLPRHRGASPISSAILAGDTVTGVCTIRMDKGMDTGDILLLEEMEIRGDDTAGTLHDRLAQRGPKVVVRTLKEMGTQTIRPIPQDHSLATYTTPVNKSHGRVDWNLDSQYLGRLVRAMNPWPGAFCGLSGEAVKIWEAQPEEGHDSPGRIAAITAESVTVGTGDGLIRLAVLQSPGRNKLGAGEFARGHRLKEGDIFE